MAKKKFDADDDDIVAAWHDLQPRLVSLSFVVPYHVTQSHPVVPWQMGDWSGVVSCELSQLAGLGVLYVTCTESAARRIRLYCTEQGWKEDS